MPGLCGTCGGSLVPVLKKGLETTKEACPSCVATRGHCPGCGERLRTPRSRQCRHCRSSWHGTDAPVIEAVAGETAESDPIAARAPSVPETSTPAAPAPTVWQVRTADGAILSDVSDDEFASGVREGWIRLEDEACKGGSFKSVREAGVAVPGAYRFINAPGAYGAMWAIPGGAVACLVGAWLSVVQMASLLEISVMAALGVMIVCAAFFFVMSQSPNFIVTGIAALIAAGLITLLTGRSFQLLQVTGLILGVCLGLFIGLGISFAIGAGVGWVLGYVFGMTQRSRYQAPAERHPVPPEIAVRATASV